MVETASEQPYVSKSPWRSGVTFLIKALIGARVRHARQNRVSGVGGGLPFTLKSASQTW